MFSIGGEDGSKKKVYHKSKNLYVMETISETPKYRKAHRVKIEQKMMDQIQERLHLQENCHRNFKERIGNNEFYLQSNYNPFSDINGKAKQNLTQMSKTEKLKVVNIIDKITQTGTQESEKQNILFLKVGENLKKTLVDLQLRSMKIVNNVQKSQFLSKQVLLKRQENNYQLASFEKNETPIRLMDIDDIASIQESNFFIKGHKKLNIFKLVRNEDVCISSYDHLESRMFNFTAVIEKRYTYKTSIYREISRLARKSIRNRDEGRQSLENYLNSHEVKVDINYLTFDDLMNCASNRLSPESATNLLQQNMVNFEIKSQSSQDDYREQLLQKIMKKTALQNKESSFVGGSQQRQQIQSYNKLGFLESQQKVQKKIRGKVENLQLVYRQQIKAYQNQISDQNIHNWLSQKAKQQILRIILEQKKDKMRGRDIDKIVRERKLKADKIQTISLKNFQIMLKQKNDILKVKNSVLRKNL